MASRYVVSAIVGTPAGRTLVPLHRRLHALAIPEWGHACGVRVYPPKTVSRLRRGRRLRLVRCSVDLPRNPRVYPLQLLSCNITFGGQLFDVAIERIVLPGPAVD